MSNKVVLTVDRIAKLTLPAGKAQAFLWDTECAGLGVRITAGAKAFIWQGQYQGKSIRITIGGIDAWRIPDARAKARELQREVDQGRDPRNLKRDAVAGEEAQTAQRAREAVTVADAWADYLKDRKRNWSPASYADHVRHSKAGGIKYRGRITVAGPLFPFMGMRVSDVTADTVKAWAAKEGKVRPTSARLSARLFKAFVRWCRGQKDYAGLIDPGIIGKATVEKLGKAKPRDGALLKSQLPDWFKAVLKINNPVASAFLRTVLLTGARHNEILGLRWDDVDFQWNRLTISDKDESKGGEDGTRVIPLTPYVKQMLESLPRRNQWVFSSTTRKEGRLADPHRPHHAALLAAGLPSLSIHDLRRSFSTLSEWLEIPVGVIAQIQGHKPSATAEKHYKVRPVDLLAVHHDRFEAWILEQAGVEFVSTKAGLKAVA